MRDTGIRDWSEGSAPAQGIPLSGSIIEQRTEGRDFALDALRAFAILEVVLAHSNLPDWLFQIRNFGVPLLMLLSGWSIGLSSERKQRSYGIYLWKRFERLVIPAWTFIVIYYCFVFLKSITTGTTFRHEVSSILGSFVFIGGIGYLWVIRVKLLISCITPFILLLTRSRLSNTRFVVICVLAMVANTLVWLVYSRYISDVLLDPVNQAIEATVFYLAGYGAVFAIGTRASSINNKGMYYVSAAFGVAFAVDVLIRYLMFGTFEQTQEYKFPPQIYYLCYAMFISFLLLANRERLAKLVSGSTTKQVVSFIGSNTLWIYLWHILALDLIVVLKERSLLPDHFAVWWFMTALIAISITWTQRQIMRPIVARAPVAWKRPLSLLSAG